MPRARTTKGLAKRISLDFFKRKSPLRRWRSRLAWAAGLAAGAVGLAVVSALAARWLRPGVIGPGGNTIGGAAAAIAERSLSPGLLSEPHAMLENDCAECHGGRAMDAQGARQAGQASSIFLAKVSDETCKLCHDGPLHSEFERFTPPCASCHVEHRGRRIVRVRDGACVSCHADLGRAIADGAAGTAKTHVTRFAPRRPTSGGGAGGTGGAEGEDRRDGHPEFAALARPDPGRIRFSHKGHLALEATWLAREGISPLECGTCHEPDSRQSLMEPISYERHCARCHRLEFDAGGRFDAFPPGSVAPHDTPRSIELFLTRTFAEEIARRPSRLGEPDPLARPAASDGPGHFLGRSSAPRAPRSADEWIAREVAGAQRVLFRKDCALCHELTWPEADASAGIPEVAPAAVPARWLERARFDHRSHRLLECESCHHEARTSRGSEDVLLPVVADCATCHRTGRSREDCALCHDYHDKRHERPVRGTMTLPVRAGRPVPSSSPRDSAPSGD